MKHTANNTCHTFELVHGISHLDVCRASRHHNLSKCIVNPPNIRLARLLKWGYNTQQGDWLSYYKNRRQQGVFVLHWTMIYINSEIEEKTSGDFYAMKHDPLEAWEINSVQGEKRSGDFYATKHDPLEAGEINLVTWGEGVSGLSLCNSESTGRRWGTMWNLLDKGRTWGGLEWSGKILIHWRKIYHHQSNVIWLICWHDLVKRQGRATKCDLCTNLQL